MGRGMKITNVTSRVVLLGDNYFEQCKINLPANEIIPAGTVLQRDLNDKKLLLPAAAASDFMGIVPFDLENATDTAKIVGFRACISGRVRADMLMIEGIVATIGQCDRLRKTGFIPSKVTDISHLDNQ